MHPHLSTLRTNPQALSGREVAQLRNDLRISLCKSVGRLANASVTNTNMATAIAHVAVNLGALIEVQTRMAEYAASCGTDLTTESGGDAHR